jgi:hypothetical protein
MVYDIRLIDCILYMNDLLSLADLSFGESYLKPSDAPFGALSSTINWWRFL